MAYGLLVVEELRDPFVVRKEKGLHQGKTICITIIILRHYLSRLTLILSGSVSVTLLAFRL